MFRQKSHPMLLLSCCMTLDIEAALSIVQHLQKQLQPPLRLSGVTPLNYCKEPQGSHIPVKTEHRQHNSCYDHADHPCQKSNQERL